MEVEESDGDGDENNEEIPENIHRDPETDEIDSQVTLLKDNNFNCK